MHTDLSPHLHTDQCNQLIQVLRQCRTDHSISKFVGKCNKEFDDMAMCLKQERIARRDRNIELSNERKARINMMYKEADVTKKK